MHECMKSTPPLRCNKLDKKDYYPIFKLTGFTGFDGSFKN